ncbi:MAG: M15 family metallopeptidase [Turicibacter sp.]|nr:M15 family metallopeptidase [Turicibacter sp.]MEE1236441.1 M15 family metallopeptidase [Turicibacter sp.]
MNKIRWSLFVVSVMFISIGLITRFTVGAKETLVNEDTQTNPVFYQDIQVVENPDSLSVLVNKNYSLPEDYKPQDLVLLDVPLYNEDVTNEGNYLRKEAASALKSLFLAAQEEGHKLVARSGYRSYETQVSLYQRYVEKDGAEAADTYSARPGHSEHQTGLTIDITSDSVQGGLTEAFGETEEGKWVKENAHRFGFIIRYPQDRVSETGYQYEPWHLRYVGSESATEIYNDHLILEDYVLSGLNRTSILWE